VVSSILADLENKIQEGLSPKSPVFFQVQHLENKLVIVIEVPAGKDVPYAFRDVIYIRAGDSTRKADAPTIRDIVMRHQIEPERWERRFSFADVNEDVDATEVRKAVSDAQKVQRAFFRDSTQPLIVLEDFSAAKYGRLTNGGDVLFAKNPATRLPQTRVRAMRFNSDKAGDKFSDMKSFEGPLHSIFEEAYSFIIRNTPNISRFTKDDPKRRDIPLYPHEAVREALVNALAHREYAAASGGVSIHVFPHRLEIWNSGSLPDGVTEENLPKGHISVLRNPDIAHALYLRGLMEKAGRGTVLMVQQCRENNLPDPVWKSDEKLGVTVTFRAPEVTPEVAPEVTPEVRKLLQNFQGEMHRRDLQTSMKLKDDEHFRKAYLLPALETGMIEMTIPDKPKSSQQKYRLTSLGVIISSSLNPTL
jgi:ATP-dependent DNA helicase RecG